MVCGYPFPSMPLLQSPCWGSTHLLASISKHLTRSPLHRNSQRIPLRTSISTLYPSVTNNLNGNRGKSGGNRVEQSPGLLDQNSHVFRLGNYDSCACGVSFLLNEWVLVGRKHNHC